MVSKVVSGSEYIDWLSVYTSYEPRMDFSLFGLNTPCDMELDNCMGIFVRYWYFGILVLDTYVGTLALYWWTDRGLFLCFGPSVKNHGYKI